MLTKSVELPHRRLATASRAGGSHSCDQMYSSTFYSTGKVKTVRTATMHKQNKTKQVEQLGDT